MKEVMIKMGNKIRLTIFLEATKLCIFGLIGFFGNLERALLNKKIRKKIINTPKTS